MHKLLLISRRTLARQLGLTRLEESHIEYVSMLFRAWMRAIDAVERLGARINAAELLSAAVLCKL